jgi:hypothetical protein
MVSILNDLSKQGVLTGTLAPVCTMELFTLMPPKHYAVFFYIAVNNKYLDQVKQQYAPFIFSEGTCPKSFEEIAHEYYGNKFMEAFEEAII